MPIVKRKIDPATILPALADELAASAFAAYYANQCSQRVYLYGKRDPDYCWSNLTILSEMDSQDTELLPVTGEPIPWSQTRQQLPRWFADRLRREPLAAIRDSY